MIYKGNVKSGSREDQYEQEVVKEIKNAKTIADLPEKTMIMEAINDYKAEKEAEKSVRADGRYASSALMKENAEYAKQYAKEEEAKRVLEAAGRVVAAEATAGGDDKEEKAPLKTRINWDVVKELNPELAKNAAAGVKAAAGVDGEEEEEEEEAAAAASAGKSAVVKSEESEEGRREEAAGDNSES